VATGSEFGFVKDPFALKPLLFAETPSAVAVAKRRDRDPRRNSG
jgi:hypothetical protein